MNVIKYVRNRLWKIIKPVTVDGSDSSFSNNRADSAEFPNLTVDDVDDLTHAIDAQEANEIEQSTSMPTFEVFFRIDVLFSSVSVAHEGQKASESSRQQLCPLFGYTCSVTSVNIVLTFIL